MQVTPLYDRLLVKRFTEEEKTKGGIIVPDSAKEKPAQGQVIAAGGREKNVIQLGEVHYERKFEGPEGIVVDVGLWAGTAPVEAK